MFGYVNELIAFRVLDVNIAIGAERRSCLGGEAPCYLKGPLGINFVGEQNLAVDDQPAGRLFSRSFAPATE